MNKEDKQFIKRYEKLLNKGYCDCNEMNCIDNNSPRRILNIVKNQDKEISRLNNIINELERFLKYEIYCDFNKEMTKGYQDTLDKLKELKASK